MLKPAVHNKSLWFNWLRQKSENHMQPKPVQKETTQTALKIKEQKNPVAWRKETYTKFHNKTHKMY